MVQIGASARSVPKRSSSLLQWLSWFSYAAIVLLCLALISTLHVFDATSHSHHGSLTDMVKQSTVSTIGYVVTITGCEKRTSKDAPFPITEGAAVLHHSIRQASVHGNMGGTYDYKMYAIYHPEAKECATTLEELGYTLVERDTPVAVADIQGDFLRERIVDNGCCGEKELIKLEAFTLVQHPVIVILDLDVLILKPLDTLFDLVLKNVSPPSDHLQWTEKLLPNDTQVVYTLDYNMVSPGRKIKPVQGGFVVIKPSMAVYDELREIVRVGDYRDNGGWGGLTGKFWGSMTFQGLIPYYYLLLHPGHAVELNRCVYNNMAQHPRWKNKDGEDKECFTQQDECEDCRARPVDEIITTHFTNCQKPWICRFHPDNIIEHKLCHDFHSAWFRVRSDMEESWGRPGKGPGEWHQDHYRGYCNHAGVKGYELIQKPYGKPRGA